MLIIIGIGIWGGVFGLISGISYAGLMFKLKRDASGNPRVAYDIPSPKQSRNVAYLLIAGAVPAFLSKLTDVSNTAIMTGVIADMCAALAGVAIGYALQLLEKRSSNNG